MDTTSTPSNECDPRLGGITKKIRISWDNPEDKILSLGDTLHMHPVPWCRLIAKTVGYDTALDHLRKYLHERIDQRFNAGKTAPF
jgi:hypothetical protein